MTKRILIDATHDEETRVAIVENEELIDYEFSVSTKEELKGNIYLAKITKIEASLQAAFIDYGEKKQGFLPFDEINISYFNLNSSQKSELFQKQKEYRDALRNKNKARRSSYVKRSATSQSSNIVDENDSLNSEDNPYNKPILEEKRNIEDIIPTNEFGEPVVKHLTSNENENLDDDDFIDEDEVDSFDEESYIKELELENSTYGTRYGYKIQDVLQAGQYILVQAVKEERGNKGAAFTTYLSIPGRYCVLMPNIAFQGGVSKKIRHPEHRRRLRNLIKSFNLADNTNIILRTASIERSDEQILDDYRYVSNLWDVINKQSNNKKPTLLLEEGSIVKKVIRDLYTDKVEEIVIDGTKAFNIAKIYAKHLAPEMSNKIIRFNNQKASIFKYYNIENEVKDIYAPVVFLKSGGYIVINPTEALVAIDVNSGKSKGKKNVEETALRTNIEAASEIMKQIKLRDIGGLIVVDFIDMENYKNRTIIEKKLKDLARNDKAKLSVGQISNFGLLEISRQRIKASLSEKTSHVCPKCYGMGYVRPLKLNALSIMRNIRSDIENGVFKTLTSKVLVKLPKDEAFYLLNSKRKDFNELESILNATIEVDFDDHIPYPFYKIEDDMREEKEIDAVLFLDQEIESNSIKEKINKAKPPVVQKYKNNHKNNHNKNVKKTSWIKKIFG
jgi:ribonuclease E